MKENLTRLVVKVTLETFAYYKILNFFLKTCKWETEHSDLEGK